MTPHALVLLTRQNAGHHEFVDAGLRSKNLTPPRRVREPARRTPGRAVSSLRTDRAQPGHSPIRGDVSTQSGPSRPHPSPPPRSRTGRPSQGAAAQHGKDGADGQVSTGVARKVRGSAIDHASRIGRAAIGSRAERWLRPPGVAARSLIETTVQPRKPPTRRLETPPASAMRVRVAHPSLSRGREELSSN